MVKWINTLTHSLPLAQSHIRTKVRVNFGVDFYLLVWLGFGQGNENPDMKGRWLRLVSKVSGGTYTMPQPV